MRSSISSAAISSWSFFMRASMCRQPDYSALSNSPGDAGAPLRCLYATSIRLPGERGQIRTQLTAHTPEQCEPLFLGTGERCRVFEAVVQLFRRAEEHRARFAGVVTDGNHVI